MDNQEKSFLNRFADLLVSRHSANLEEVIIVLPSKRAITFLNKAISEKTKRPLFSPIIYTIHDWIQTNSEKRLVSGIELSLSFFEVYKTIIEKEAQDDINEFIKWCAGILNDFDEIDRYLLDPKIVFKDLRNVKEIEAWSFGEEQLSIGQTNYLKFWNKIIHLYNGLDSYLNKKGLTTSGKIFRDLANHPQSVNNQIKSKIYFVGFNALTPAEEKIIFSLKQMGKAEILFDVDDFYVNEEEHEAGLFYRKLRDKHYLRSEEIGQDFNAMSKKFSAYETAHELQQIPIVHDVVSNSIHTNIAIIPADENLVIPILEGLPRSAEEINVTLGFPLKQTSFGSLLHDLFELQFSFQKFGTDKLHYKSIIAFLDQPLLNTFISRSEFVVFEEDLIQHNSVFINANDIIKRFPKLELLAPLIKPWRSIQKDGIESLSVLLYLLFNALENKSGKYEYETLKIFYDVIGDFKTKIDSFEPKFDLKTFRRIFLQELNDADFSFYSNPTSGIQVMGILESRTLDFDHIIFTGLNEGNLPKNNVSNSIIPRDLRIVHGLPNEEERGAIFAHHFYRLLHRAKQVDLIYVSGNDSIGVAEQSRYITQLNHRIEKDKIHSWNFFSAHNSDLGKNESNPLFLQTPISKLIIKEYLQTRGLSASALNKLILCPLDFYYRYVMGLKDQEEVEENIDASTFGTQIHEVLEVIFKKEFLEQEKPLNKEDLKRLKKDLEPLLKAAYAKSDFSEDELATGKNQLSFQVSLQFLERFIEQQIKEVDQVKEDIFIIALEENLEMEFQVKLEDEIIPIKFTGNIDRIDRVGDHYRIIDYKSGKCTPDKLSFGKTGSIEDKWIKLFYNKDKGYARQLFLYSLLFNKNSPNVNSFSAGIIPMVNISDWNVQIVDPYLNASEISITSLDTYQNLLSEALTSLLSDEMIFEHNPKSDYCEFCN